MQRLIRSFNTLTDELKETLQEQYPDGIDASHIKTIPTAKGDILRVIELSTPEAMYLIKINPESRAEIEEFLDQDTETATPGEDGEAEPELDGADAADDTGGDEETDDMDDDAGDDDGDDMDEEEVSKDEDEDEE